MPRRRFDCLWCGRPWQVRSDDDLEGWAALCPDCLGRADDNGFLRQRLRRALRERAAAAGAETGTEPAPGRPAVTLAAAPAMTGTPTGVTAAADPGDGPDPGSGSAASAPARAWEDWYLRRGRYARGPIHDGPWSMELEQATRWLDGLDLGRVVVQLGADTGWWTTLLAARADVWLYDADPASIEAARRRLLAHGLQAHLHLRDPLAPADRAVDAVFAAYWLSAAGPGRDLDLRIAAARGWLAPGASLAILEAGPGEAGAGAPGAPSVGSRPVECPAGPLWRHHPELLRERLSAAGFVSVELGGTTRAFVLGHARVAT